MGPSRTSYDDQLSAALQAKADAEAKTRDYRRLARMLTSDGPARAVPPAGLAATIAGSRAMLREARSFLST